MKIKGIENVNDCCDGWWEDERKRKWTGERRGFYSARAEGGQVLALACRCFVLLSQKGKAAEIPPTRQRSGPFCMSFGPFRAVHGGLFDGSCSIWPLLSLVWIYNETGLQSTSRSLGKPESSTVKDSTLPFQQRFALFIADDRHSQWVSRFPPRVLPTARNLEASYNSTTRSAVRAVSNF